MDINILEWVGYAASLLVLISLLMSSIIKLRWINLIGSAIFCVYGFLIGSIPVGIMNGGIIIINIYYLIIIYNAKEHLKLITLYPNSEYLAYFMEFYRKDMLKYFPERNLKVDSENFGFYILRDVIPAAIFIAKKVNENTLEIQIDYAIPAYRDLKIAYYLYHEKKDYFISKGFTRLTCSSINKDHDHYLETLGFTKNTDNRFVINLN